MKIESVRCYVYEQPYQDKGWAFALSKASVSRGLIVEIRADGVVGYGYAASAVHIGELIDGMREAVLSIFTPHLIGRDPFDVEALMDLVDRSLRGYSRTKAAVEAALHDIVGKAVGQPLYRLWGGLVRDRIPVVRIIPIKDPDAMARNAERVVADGFRALKIKVGYDPDEDVARVRAVRAAVGGDITLTLDANQGWGTPAAAIRALRAMDDLGVALVEQPVRVDDFDGLKTVSSSVSIPVEADESAASLGDVMRLAATRAVDRVSLKTGKLGGPRNVKRAAAICEAANIRCRMGMSGASRMIAAVDMHLIASTPNIDFACEVGEFTRMESDATDGLEVVGGELAVPTAPGHGAFLRVDPATLG